MFTRYNQTKTILIALIAFLCTSCGGSGGGGSSYEISTDVAEVKFNFYAGDTDSKSENVIVSFKGDGVIVGYPPGEPEPFWLDIETVTSSTTKATFKLTAQYNDFFTDPGVYSVDLRFLTGKEDGSQIEYEEVTVTLTVKEIPEPLSFSIHPSSNDLMQAINISDYILNDELSTWELISSDVTWLTLDQSSGTTASETLPELIIKKDDLVANDAGKIHKGTLTIVINNGSISQQEITIQVNAFIQALSTEINDSTANEFHFTIDEAAMSVSNQKLFFVDQDARNVYTVDIKTGETVSYYDFTKTPQSINVSPNGQYLYVALKNNEDSYEVDFEGAIAVIDLETDVIINNFLIKILPNDIEGNDQGLVFVSAANGQHTTLNSYNAFNGELDLIADSVYQGALLSLSATQNSVYAVDTGLSPQNLYHYTPGNGELNEQESPFHGSYQIGDNLWTGVNDELILTPSGNLFDQNTLDYESTIASKLTNTIIDVAVDKVNNKLLVLEGYFSHNWRDNSDDREGLRISSFDLPEFDNNKLVSESAVNPQFIFSLNGEILIIEKHDSHYQLQKI